MSFVPSSFCNGKGISFSRFSVSGSRTMVTTSPAFTSAFRRASAFTRWTADRPGPDRAAPSVAVDCRFDRHFGFTPVISRVERQRGISV